MNRHGYGSDDAAFDRFRREKTRRRRQHQEVQGESLVHSVRSETVRLIEEGDQREARELKLHREMFEFVRDTIKVAAGVLSTVTDDQRENVARQISGEMEDFFKSTSGGAEDAIELLRDRHDLEETDTTSEQLEVHLGELGIQDLDRWRREGLEEIARRHLGQPVERTGEDGLAGDEAHVGVAEEEAPETEHPETEHPEAEHREPRPADFGIDDDIAAPEHEGLLAAVIDLDEATGAWPTGTARAPRAFADLLSDVATRKQTLTLLVQHDLLSREQAREIFVQMKHLLAPTAWESKHSTPGAGVAYEEGHAKGQDADGRGLPPAAGAERDSKHEQGEASQQDTCTPRDPSRAIGGGS